MNASTLSEEPAEYMFESSAVQPAHCRSSAEDASADCNKTVWMQQDTAAASNQMLTCWVKRCKELGLWVEAKGRLPITRGNCSKSEDKAEASLAVWLSSQLMRRQAGKLIVWQQEQLEAIPGMQQKLDQRISRKPWSERFDELERWCICHGSRLPSRKRNAVDANEKSLAAWLNACQKKHKADLLSEDQISRLKNLPGFELRLMLWEEIKLFAATGLRPPPQNYMGTAVDEVEQLHPHATRKQSTSHLSSLGITLPPESGSTPGSPSRCSSLRPSSSSEAAAALCCGDSESSSSESSSDSEESSSSSDTSAEEITPPAKEEASYPFPTAESNAAKAGGRRVHQLLSAASATSICTSTSPASSAVAAPTDVQPSRPSETPDGGQEPAHLHRASLPSCLHADQPKGSGVRGIAWRAEVHVTEVPSYDGVWLHCPNCPRVECNICGIRYAKEEGRLTGAPGRPRSVQTVFVCCHCDERF